MKLGRMFISTISVLLAVLCITSSFRVAFAAENIINMPGNVYEFEDNEHYEFFSSDVFNSAAAGNTMGTFSITGNGTDVALVDGVQTCTVSSGNLSFSYVFNSAILNAEKTSWHLIDDKSKKVDTLSLNKNILSGAIIVQSSSDGTNWITDVQMTDVFAGVDVLSEPIYTTKDVQMENGCYFRVIVAYEQEIKTGEKKIAFVTTDVVEKKKNAEVYEFYAISRETAGTASSAADTPRKVVANKPINTGKDNGYSGNEAIDSDDPHFGWELGDFVINGYTRETTYNGSPVYLKNVGDKVTLWFTLKQDIICLNGDSALIINEDTNGYDQKSGVSKTNFGHGALIISYTDYEGVTHDPIIYTDFLAANARTGADTRVQLFEEGDYVVTLDYEIKNNPRQIGPVSVIPTYTDYKITFSFSIRNGNCMVYPFDTTTNNELSDNAVTANGFRLDMARSRYLNIDVARSVLNVGTNGQATEDVRFSRPAKDSDSYTDEGIYTFTVTNLYTGTTNTKNIYVGTDSYLLALSVNNLSVEGLNAKISEGYTVDADGTLTAPPEPEPEPEFETENELETENEEEIEPEPEESIPETDVADVLTDVADISDIEQTAVDEVPTDEVIEEITETKQSGSFGLFVILVIAAAVGMVVAICIKGKDENKKGGSAE